MKAYLISLFFLVQVTMSQHIGRAIGRVLDNSVQNPIPYAIVQVVGDTVRTIESDSLGFYEIKDIPVGSYKLEATSEGYKKASIPIVVEQSITTKNNIYLEEDITKLATVTLYSEQDNPYKVTSSYSFDAKDFAKSSTSFGDPSRLVQTLPGVAAASDGSNQIAVRGNSPFNNNWYLEGIEIPNPNHFGGYGSSGGFISVFNENTLEKFDFYLGAYPAMYGNSNSSVFDMKLRAGNIRKREHNVRVSPLGIYGATEGYFKKGRRSSYLVNGRIFDLYFFKKWGLVPTKDISIPAFNDFSYKISVPNKNDKLEINLFGFGAANSLQMLYTNKIETRRNQISCNNLNLNYRYSQKLRFSSTFQFSYLKNKIETRNEMMDTVQTDEKILRNHTYIHFKKNSRLHFRIGAMLAFKYSNILYLWGRQRDTDRNKWINIYRHEYVKALISEPYFNGSYRCSESTKIIFGVHTLNISLNDQFTLEPRLGISSKINNKYEIALSSGLYSKLPSFYVYKVSGDTLPSTRSLQIVNSHTFNIDTSFQIKSEVFYQYLWNAYLYNSYFRRNGTMLNQADQDFYLSYSDVGNMTIGHNYGLDLSVQKKFKPNIVINFAGAFYRSQYKDNNKIWRNTAFDNKFTASLQASKEFLKNKSYGFKSFIFSMKMLYFGGFYTIPIDYSESLKYGETMYNPNTLFTQKLPNYFRLDLGCQISYSRKNIKHELRFDVQNTTNRKNVLKQYYDTQSRSIRNIYQLPIIPVISYTAYF